MALLKRNAGPGLARLLLRFGKAWVYFALLCLTAGTAAQAVSEYQVKAAFLYNFAKFVDWPGDEFSSPAEPLRVCIFGEDPFGATIDELMREKLAQGRPLTVRRISAPPAARSCQILFVPQASRSQSRELLGQVKGAVLTVGETPEFLRDGGIINLTLEQNRVRFEVNLQAAERSRLKISSKLLVVARFVYGGPPT